MTAAVEIKKSVLLIEDDQFLSALLKTRLAEEGLEVALVQSADEALASLREKQPDLILLDVILPGRSGFELMEQIAGDPAASRVPIIVISNLGQEADIARGKQLKAVEYLVKAQTSIDQLVEKVKEFLVK